MDAATFYSTTTPPHTLPEATARMGAFVSDHAARGGKIVLVTSGGTVSVAVEAYDDD